MSFDAIEILSEFSKAIRHGLLGTLAMEAAPNFVKFGNLLNLYNGAVTTTMGMVCGIYEWLTTRRV